MKIYQGLILAAFLTAALALAGCESSKSLAPEDDTSKKIQTSNNPADRPGDVLKPPGARGGQSNPAGGETKPAGGQSNPTSTAPPHG